MLRALTALCLGVAFAGDDVRAPLIFFRKPDRETAREIEGYISNNGLGASTRKSRTRARRELRKIGAWSVPPLTATIAGRKRLKDIRIPMNATMTLARILDPQCVPALQEVAKTHRDPEVRKTACLALGIFGEDPKYPGSVELLGRLLGENDPRKEHQRAAALGLGKIATEDARIRLLGQLEALPSQEHQAAAILLGACLRSPKVEPLRFVQHKERIVRLVAATCLLIRPVRAQRVETLLGLVKRPNKDERLRALHFHALGAMPRTEAIRKRLLDCAKTSREEKGVRVAALIELAREWNVRSNLPVLKRAWTPLKARNDPLAAALLFAMVRSGDPEAIDILLRVVKQGSDLMRFYAGGSLLHYAFLTRTDERQEREGHIRDAVARFRSSRLSGLRKLDDLRGAAAYKSDLAKRAEIAREHFRTIRDRFRLHLWDWTPEDRAWSLVNELLVDILELDDIAHRGDVFGREGESGDGGDDGRSEDDGPSDNPEKKLGTDAKVGRAVTGTPDEQDMLDFLREEPYYGPRDLGGS
jgi:HEAT repeat protein